MKNILLSFCLLCFFATSIKSQNNQISSFESTTEWQQISSEGAEVTVSEADGLQSKSIRIDYNFTGAGWCGVEKKVKMNLPADYKFSWYIKGKGLKNNLEFKLVDSTGDNVWWLNQRNFELPAEWEKQVARKRNIHFAWGPVGGGDLLRLDKIQIIIAASEGGKGTVYLDELSYDVVLPPNITIKPVITASSSTLGSEPFLITDKNINTGWSTNESSDQWLKMDFGYPKEFGGIVLQWGSKPPKNYTLEISDDDNTYSKVFENGTGKKDFLFIKNGEARYIRLNMNDGEGTGLYLNELEIKPLEFSDHPNNFFTSVASYYPKGWFPRYFYNVQTFWNIIGVSGDFKEALLNEDGAFEVDKASFRVEPYLFTSSGLITWNDVKLDQTLEEDYLPIPSVKWNHNDFELQVKAFAAGEKGASFTAAQYIVVNKSNKDQEVNLYLALRPYQVNPPWQFLNTIGGASKIYSVSSTNNIVQVDNKKIISLTPFDDFGASLFSKGEIITHISNNSLPPDKLISDHSGFGSAAVKYTLKIPAGGHRDVIITVPFYEQYPERLNSISKSEALAFFNEQLKDVKAYWHNRLDRVDFELPASADKMINTLKSNLAYILINRDGPAIQPGSRSYERAWIRDGALTSSALLRLGLHDEVKEYLDWYSKNLFPSGKVPCVVDQRGPDPTPENDSHGQYIFALLQYYTFTRDTAFLHDKLETILKAVDYIEFLVSQRKTPQYQKKDSLAFYGLVPESISHEGYSAKPMHSYWDDFFILRGLKDAVTICSILNKDEEADRIAKLRDEFKINLYSSIDLAMKNHNINYIPGCVELGDFDATSTTISIYPGNELGNLPQPALNNTFDKYYDYFTKRKNPDFKWDAYTPYEIRTAGTFLYLGQKEKTYELLDFFFNDQRPKKWNHWAEVVWKDERAPKFIGDMPHTWIGSDYINVVRSIFIFEREYDSSLVVGLGFKEEWIDDPKGIVVKNQSTYYGDINYSIRKDGASYKAEFTGNITLPAGKMKLVNFESKKPSQVLINGRQSLAFTEKEITIDEFPAEVIIKY